MDSTIPSIWGYGKVPKKPRKKQKEGAVVNSCLRWLFAHGCFVWRNNTGALPNKHGRIVRYGLKGSADLVGVTARGDFIAVECKSAKGRMTPEQRLFRDRIQEKGGIYVLARSEDDLELRKREIVGAHNA